MQVVAFSSARSGHDGELQQFERLAATLSSRFARLHVEEIAPAIVGALEQTGRAIDVDACALIEFTEGAIGAMHTWPSAEATFGEAGCPPRWLVDKLTRREVVAIPGIEGAPRAGRDGVHPAEDRAGLSVPVVVAEQVVCALVICGRQSAPRWSDPVVERVRLIAEIFGVALQRCRQETALRASVATIERLNARLAADNDYLQEEIKTYHDFDDIVGGGASLRVALTRLGQVAPMNSSVLLLGETGTGKELFARALHDRSRRRGRALVRVNCAALPPTLVESELFGHEKGAFTGAVSTRQGRFELADGGTIFLDEIGDLPPEIQAKLLRVLQEGEFERVGSSRTQRADVRVIAATHRDLEADVASGRFRADLYYRLSVFPIHLPALRERRRGHPVARLVLHPAASAGARPPHHQGAQGRDVGAPAARLAGQRPRAGERHRAGDDPVDRRDAAARRYLRTRQTSESRRSRGGRRHAGCDPAGAHRGGAVRVRLADQRPAQRRRAPRPSPQHAPLPDEEARHRLPGPAAPAVAVRLTSRQPVEAGSRAGPFRAHTRNLVASGFGRKTVAPRLRGPGLTVPRQNGSPNAVTSGLHRQETAAEPSATPRIDAGHTGCLCGSREPSVRATGLT